MRVDLIWLSHAAAPLPAWELGEVVRSAPDAAALALRVDTLPDKADAFLFWDSSLGAPDADRVRDALTIPGDVWHAGLRLGQGGLPRTMDFVNPVWRLNRDPDDDIVATSWRLSLRACLVKATVLRTLGGPSGSFDTLAAAALELGHRWISCGALMRHVPSLLADDQSSDGGSILTPADEFAFVRARYGRQWSVWALWRAIANGWGRSTSLAAYRAAASRPPISHPPALRPVGRGVATIDRDEWLPVTVLIPTLDRYPHLFNVLDQIRHQTVPPIDVVVVDQTAHERRDVSWPERFEDLPLTVIWQDEAGQCSSRNAGLAAARGEAVLFLDDDDEIEADLIARHLAFLAAYNVDASCGVAEEVGAGELPPDFQLVRDSDVFPTNNSLLRKDALLDSGLFDLAYERGERADGDLGMRLYLAGKLLVLNPDASVLHLHAPRGGLRQHGARVTTNAASRASLAQRQLLAPTEAYLWQRYFTARQVEEALLIRSAAAVRARQGGWRGLARMGLMAAALPDTYRQNKQRLADGRHLLQDHPSIPTLRGNPVEEIL